MTEPLNTMRIYGPIKIGDTHAGQLTFLCQMMHWLREKNLPYGGSDLSMYFFAETNHVVGCVETRFLDDYLWIQAIYVDPGLRRRGIGEKLVSSVVSFYSRGAPVVFGLGTQPDNDAMKALAHKLEFTHEVHQLWRR